MTIFLTIVLLAHLAIAGHAQVLIYKTFTLTKTQKVVNSILNWLIPFLWSFLVRNMIRPAKLEVMTKSDRKVSTNQSSDNWGSVPGVGGGADITP